MVLSMCCHRAFNYTLLILKVMSEINCFNTLLLCFFYAYSLPGHLSWLYWIGYLIHSTSIHSSSIIKSDGLNKYSFPVTESEDITIYSSPVIGSNGSVYFGSNDSYINAITSEGTSILPF